MQDKFENGVCGMLFYQDTGQIFKKNGITDNCQFKPENKLTHSPSEQKLLVLPVRIIHKEAQ